MIYWQNPYTGTSDIWLKGNLHAHSAPQSPCGRLPLDRVLELYKQAGYDFLAISNHQHYSPVPDHAGLLLLPGLEWNSRTELQSPLVVNRRDHLGVYSLDAPLLEKLNSHFQPLEVLESIQGSDALVVLNHPNWLVPHHYSEEELFKLYPGVDGVEIYNAVIERHPGNADATMKWDRILTEMGPILGFASDDSHFEEDIGKACIMVNVEEPSVENIFSSIKQGRFYCSTGVEINAIGQEGDEVFCAADEDVVIEASGENGQVYASSLQHLRVSLSKEKSSYIRFTLYGQGKKQAWSQPFFFMEQQMF